VKKALGFMVVATVIAAGAPVAPAQPPNEVVGTPKMGARHSLEPMAVPGELIVDFEPGTNRPEGRRLLAARDADLGERIGGSDLSVVKIDPDRDLLRAARRYRALPLVRRAEPNYLRFLDEAGPNPKLPDDEHFAELWGLHNEAQEHVLANPPPETAAGTADADVDAPEAWEVQTGSAETVVAVLDSGVDPDHPDLAAGLWANPGEAPANGIDDDDNGFVDDVHGWDFGDDDATLFEPDVSVVGYDHGTHVAGTIGAQVDNGIGVAGVCPGCKVMILKGSRKFDIDGDGTFEMAIAVSDEIEALAYALDMGADIVSGSFAAPFYSRPERDALEELGSAGILTVLAAGNQNADNDLLLFAATGPVSPAFPASYDLPGVLSVGASNHRDEYAYDTGCAIRAGDSAQCAFTNWGAVSVDVVAPGTDVLSTVPGAAYDVKVGTSMSVPHVAGIAGLVESQHPEYGAIEIKNAILNAADRVPTLGVLNAFADGPVEGAFTRTSARVNALAALEGSPIDIEVPSDGTIAGAIRIAKEAVGDIAWPEDTNDVYRKTLRRGFRYKVVLVGPSEGDLDLVVYKPAAVDVWQFDGFCVSLQPPCGAVVARAATLARREKVVFKARAGRAYYFHVAGYFTRAPYRLKVERLPKKKR
jgi:subtilisin family serine protease